METLMEPKIRFESDEELQKYARYWIGVLLLNNWCIRVELVQPDEIEGLQGTTKQVSQQEEGLIKIADLVDNDGSYISKICQEKTLVHELLHLKYSYVDPFDTRDGREAYYNEHKLIEQMSKSLLMVRYGITLDWFKNNH